MDKKAYKQLLVSLKKCELNYHAHVREFGKLGKSEINFWAEQLIDYNAKNIEKSFNNHINYNAFFPTVKDIRYGTNDNPKRKQGDDWEQLAMLEEQKLLLPEPEKKRVGMPDNMKNILHKLQKAVKERHSLEKFRAEIKTTISD